MFKTFSVSKIVSKGFSKTSEELNKTFAQMSKTFETLSEELDEEEDGDSEDEDGISVTTADGSVIIKGPVKNVIVNGKIIKIED